MTVNRTIKALLVFIFVLNLSDALFSPLFAVFVKGWIIGATLATVGMSLAIFSVVKSILQIPLAKFLDRRNHRNQEFYFISIGSLLSTCYAVGLIGASSIHILYLLSALSGVAAAFHMAAFYGMFSRNVDRKLLSYEWSLYSVGGLTVSTAIGAMVGGIMADHLGFPVVLSIVATLNLVAVGIFVMLLPLRDRANR